MANSDKPGSSPEKLVETTVEKDELTEQELDKISGGPRAPPGYGYIGETEKN
jgi:bacteriocin-like protein